MIIKQLEVGRLAVFCYIVGCEETGEAALIDPAADTDRIIDTLSSLNLKATYVINTHCHPDHTSGNQDIVEETGAKIVIHTDEAKMLSGVINKTFTAMFGGKSSPPADIAVSDGDVITVGTVSLEVIHTPGHSPGGICLWDREKNVFTGDTLFVAAVGRTDLPGGSMRVMMDSIKNRILTLPDDTVVWPGHNYGPASSSTVAREREGNPFLTF